MDSVHLMNKNRNTFLNKTAQINFPVSSIPNKKFIPGNTVADAVLISAKKVKRICKISKLHFTAYVFIRLHLKADLFEDCFFIF